MLFFSYVIALITGINAAPAIPFVINLGTVAFFNDGAAFIAANEIRTFLAHDPAIALMNKFSAMNAKAVVSDHHGRMAGVSLQKRQIAVVSFGIIREVQMSSDGMDILIYLFCSSVP